MPETLIKVENVSKKFCRSLRRSLWYGMKDLGNELIGQSRKDSEELRPDEFWAVKDVSFELRRGECLGLIGRNGSGKSTLLKTLNGLFRPEKGRVEIKGRVGALIELGAGFNPILTGRENIYINGSVLGLKKEEIKHKFDDIVDFAEISEFIDMPVQSYSSGMKVRLGFAIAAQLEPDVLLIDEVLAVGDVGFSMKCFNRIFDISKNTAIILVSHSMPQVLRVASSIILMDKGVKVAQGDDIAVVIEKYFDNFKPEKLSISGNGKAILHEIKLNSEKNGDSNNKYTAVHYHEDLCMDLYFSIDIDVKIFSIHIGIMNRSSQIIAQCFSRVSGQDFNNSGDTMHVKLRLPKLPFAMGTYSLNVNFVQNSVDDQRGTFLAQYRAIKKFKVIGYKASLSAPIQLSGKWEIVH